MQPTIAQLGQASTGVPALPDAPAWQVYLLEQPWYVAAGLVVLGIVAFVGLNRAGRARAGVLAAAGAAVLGAGIFAIATLVTTEREVLQARTLLLVDNAAKADTGALRTMLQDRLTIWVGSTPSTMTLDSVLESVSATLGSQFRIREHSTGAVQAVVDAPLVARSQVHVKARSDATGYDIPIGSWWRIDWRREGDKPDGPWRLTGLTLMQLDGVPSLDAARQYLRP